MNTEIYSKLSQELYTKIALAIGEFAHKEKMIIPDNIILGLSESACVGMLNYYMNKVMNK